ncbi:MAG: hypothetical protein EA409_10715 [Saprospirales bacterium]|nr:MAG: hypothetical protein EA409_10715 [Saprospirales bacterium]
MKYIALSFLFLFLLPTITAANQGENFSLGGYFQGNPVYLNAELPMPFGEVDWMEYRLQNRLNVRWSLSSEIDVHAQMRTRFFAGDLVRNIPGYSEGIDSDDGLMNLSWLVFDHSNWLLHFIPDRLYFQYTRNNWDVRVGRQRVNWGVNMITNPNDIFNIYSFYDFDYIERPGSDAVRVQRHMGFGKRLEVAIRPDRRLRNSVAGLLYAFRANDYDVQLISAYYRNRIAIGGGWAGNLGSAGLKGEVMAYRDIEKQMGRRSFNFISAISVDYMFPSGLFVIGEFLYNHDGGQEAFVLLAENLAPDNPSFSRYQLALQLRYPINPLLDLIYANIYYPDEKAVFISPGINWSVAEDLDFQLLSQIFVGSRESSLSNAASLVTASLRYSF